MCCSLSLLQHHMLPTCPSQAGVLLLIAGVVQLIMGVIVVVQLIMLLNEVCVCVHRMCTAHVTCTCTCTCHMSHVTYQLCAACVMHTRCALHAHTACAHAHAEVNELLQGPANPNPNLTLTLTLTRSTRAATARTVTPPATSTLRATPARTSTASFTRPASATRPTRTTPIPTVIARPTGTLASRHTIRAKPSSRCVYSPLVRVRARQRLGLALSLQPKARTQRTSTTPPRRLQGFFVVIFGIAAFFLFIAGEYYVCKHDLASKKAKVLPPAIHAALATLLRSLL